MFRMLIATLALGLTVAVSPAPAQPGPAVRLTPAGGQKVALNPQPRPPRWQPAGSRFGKVMLNPQPLPPRMVRPSLGKRKLGSPFGKVMLNPQPLPPRVQR